MKVNIPSINGEADLENSIAIHVQGLNLTYINLVNLLVLVKVQFPKYQFLKLILL